MGEVQLVDDADTAIAASGQPNGINALIVHVFLKDCCAKIIIAGKYVMPSKKPVVINGNKEAKKHQINVGQTFSLLIMEYNGKANKTL